MTVMLQPVILSDVNTIRHLNVSILAYTQQYSLRHFTQSPVMSLGNYQTLSAYLIRGVMTQWSLDLLLTMTAS